MGAGLTNMRDRITSLGGTLALDSSASHGTRVHGSVPDPWLDAAAEQRPFAAGMSGMDDGVGADLEEASLSPADRGNPVNGRANGARSRASSPERT